MSETMKAIRVHDWGEPSGMTLEAIERPEPGRNEVLAKVNCASLNWPDILKVAGKHQSMPTLPFSPGSEFSGIVEKMGEGADGFEPGQRVLARIGTGAFAEYVCVPIEKVQAIPDCMPDEDAAAFSMAYHTSYIGLVHRARFRRGETVLVHSAAGGVSLAAVQIAKALGARTIIGTVGSDDKKDFVLEQGADVAVNYETEDFVEAVNSATDGAGADIVYDPVGGKVCERSTKCIASEGRILIIGFTSGEFTNFRSNHMLVKNYSVIGLFLRRTNPKKSKQCWDEVLQLYKDGAIKPVISKRFPMENAAEAMSFLSSRKAFGKIILHW